MSKEFKNNTSSNQRINVTYTSSIFAWFITQLTQLHTALPPLAYHSHVFKTNNNFLLTEREGRTGEYWPEVVAVRTERREVRTKTTKGQYSPVRLKLA